MANYNLLRLDLNLLVSLDALLSERSVTKAAQRLGLSQPALSASLSRLRIHFGDPLLARRGNTYELTPLAARLAEHVPSALDAVRRVFASEAAFDPSQASREFTVFGSDYAFATIGRIVTQLAAERAPGVRFRFRQHTPTIVDDAVNTLRTADGMLIPHGFLNNFPHADVIDDTWKILVSADNDAVGDELTMQNLRELPWVTTYQSRTAYTPPARQLEMLGVEPHVEAIVEGFLALPFFVMGTRRIALIQSALAPHFPASIGVRFLEPPFDAVRLVGALWWHPMHSRDPAHEWMRDLFAEAGRMLADAPAPAN
ncbi:LysR family transcriptional regulator [Salinibacterium sp. SYSU T00001]|uniref:LysR family transcriptional regulator n=1 Tax=Homoserinimonas sedimenticola TaxID=2986805 RepID=UPI0022355970|nr:LysR family transcriptional regulator [Salinibacterium sedimenticola]MCW4385132.1 LysR family transcriptional regulator [Salinibacterium sedimenticola]